MAKRTYTSKAPQQSPDAMPAVEFDLDDVIFTGDGAISTMDFAEYARLANQGIDSKDPSGVAIIADVFLGLLGKQTYQRFRAHCREHRTDDGTLVEILKGIMQDAAEAATNRPTQRPSPSPDGPASGQATRTVVSFSRATVDIAPEQQEPPREEPQEAVEQPPKLVSYG